MLIATSDGGFLQESYLKDAEHIKLKREWVVRSSFHSLPFIYRSLPGLDIN